MTPFQCKGRATNLVCLAKAVIATCLIGTSALADPSFGFGPNPRSFDNKSVFDYSDPAHVTAWDALRASGVDELVINSTFVMSQEITYGKGVYGDFPQRFDLNYLDESELSALNSIQDAQGFKVVYEAGIGLSADACDFGLSALDIGTLAAEREYKHVVSRLLNAKIQISAVNADGVFLRLLGDSAKFSGCAVWVPVLSARGKPRPYDGAGFDMKKTTLAALHYLKHLRNLINSHPGQVGNPDVAVRLLINLPNWQVQQDRRLGNPKGPASINLVDVIKSFKIRLRNDRASPSPLTIDKIVVDYPYSHVLGDQSKFVRKVKHLWNSTRGMNAAGAASRRSPGFHFIVNTSEHRHPCIDKEVTPKTPPFFLLYRGIDGVVASQACRDKQNNDDSLKSSDLAYMRHSEEYADRLRPGGSLYAQLVVAGKVRIGDRIEKLVFQSWTGANPVSNLDYMTRVRKYVERTRK